MCYFADRSQKLTATHQLMIVNVSHGIEDTELGNCAILLTNYTIYW